MDEDLCTLRSTKVVLLTWLWGRCRLLLQCLLFVIFDFYQFSVKWDTTLDLPYSCKYVVIKSIRAAFFLTL